MNPVSGAGLGAGAAGAGAGAAGAGAGAGSGATPTAAETAIAAWKTANGRDPTDAIKTWIRNNLGAMNINNYGAGTQMGAKNNACSGVADCLPGASCGSNNKCTDI
jgi:hypothetical protein